MSQISVMLPDELAAEMRQAAEAQGLTLDELIQAATERYLQLERLQRPLRYGQARAHEAGISEEDLPRLMKEWRR